MIALGIDPGRDGAVAAYDGVSVEAITLPWIDGEGVDVCALTQWWDAYSLGVDDPACVAIERVNSFGMGRQSAFVFGAGVGALVAWTRMNHWRIERPTPVAWQRAVMGATAKGDKQRAVRWCRDRWPRMQWPRSKAKQSGIADAACIAVWAWRQADAG